jgi:hypothetical protein
MVDPPNPYVEIDEIGRDIIVPNKISYSDKELQEALFFFNNPEPEDSWYSYVMDDDYHYYEYHITEVTQKLDEIIISIEWDNFKE